LTRLSDAHEKRISQLSAAVKREHQLRNVEHAQKIDLEQQVSVLMMAMNDKSKVEI
jgi:hypothetical protein